MGFFDKLKNGLLKTKNAIVGKIDSLFKAFRKVDEDLFDELEELLISADVGVNTTEDILEELREFVKENKIKEADVKHTELLLVKALNQRIDGLYVLKILGKQLLCGNLHVKFTRDLGDKTYHVKGVQNPLLIQILHGGKIHVGMQTIQNLQQLVHGSFPFGHNDW